MTALIATPPCRRWPQISLLEDGLRASECQKVIVLKMPRYHRTIAANADLRRDAAPRHLPGHATLTFINYHLARSFPRLLLR